MLFPSEQVRQLVAQKGAGSIEWRVLGHWLQAEGTPSRPVRWLTDSRSDPGVVIRLQEDSCMVLGDQAQLEPALRWMATSEDWASAEIYLDRVSAAVRAAALAAGFTDESSQRQPSYSAQAWYLEGEPRFADQVRHPCRMATGLELLQLFLSVAEDEQDKEYLQCCLEAGPSFLCEVAGEPVCWSLTHLGGAMGRIFTPPQARGRGYARSLTAFQVDDTLHRRGIAVASVSIENSASYRMLEAVGAEHLAQPLTWSRMHWPTA